VPKRLSSVNMLAMLKKAGYKKQITASTDEKVITISALDKFVKIVGNEVSGSKNNGVNSKMRVEIRFLTSLTAEEVIKMLTGSTGKGEKGEE
jgi:hypothetical protein